MASHDSDKSRSQRRREYLALHALGEELVRLSPGHLARMPLAEPLRVAVQQARRLEGGAYRRHLRYIAKLVSRGDPEASVPRLSTFPMPDRRRGRVGGAWRRAAMGSWPEAMKRYRG